MLQNNLRMEKCRLKNLFNSEEVILNNHENKIYQNNKKDLIVSCKEERYDFANMAVSCDNLVL